MKRLLLLLCLLSVFVACSDDKKDEPEQFPVTDLVMPEGNQIIGNEIMIAGNGFAPNCMIMIRLEGTAPAEMEIVEVTEKGVTFKLPANVGEGEYMVLLKQDGQTYELGKIKIVADEVLESTLYGLFINEGRFELSPISVIDQKKGKVLCSLGEFEDVSGIVTDNHGKIYYNVIVGAGKNELYYYDLKTDKSSKINWDGASSCFAISTDGEKLYALTTDTDFNIVLHSVTTAGSATEIMNYGNPLDVDYSRLYAEGGTFLYGEENFFVGLRIDMGDVVYKASLGCDLDSDYSDLYTNDELARTYEYVRTKDNYYVFTGEESNNKLTTSVQKFEEEDMWDGSPYNNPIVTSFDGIFVSIVYDETTELIYGLSGEEGEEIQSYNPEEDKVQIPWKNTGCVKLVYIPALK